MVADQLQELPRVGFHSAMKLAERGSQKVMLDARGETVSEITVERHPVVHGAAAIGESRAEDEVCPPLRNRLDQSGDALRRVLIVGMEQHDDVGALRKGPVVTRLLVTSIAAIFLMPPDLEPGRARDVDGVVGARVIDDETLT